MDGMHEYTLTVTNYTVEDDGTFNKTRVSIAPHKVEFTISSYDTFVKADGRDLKKVNVVLDGGNNLELFVSEVDLLLIERSHATFYLQE